MTTAADLATATGINRAVFLKISGLEPIFWQRKHPNSAPAGWGRSIIQCLDAPKEFSSDISLGEMSSSVSAMTFSLGDYQDSDNKSYFGKLFGAPGRWDESRSIRIADGTDYGQVIDANDATIYATSTIGFEPEKSSSATWSELSPLSTPNAVVDFSNNFAFDRTRAEGVLFGGDNAANAELDETWTYKNGEWTQESPVTSPAARNNCCMCWDSTNERILMFGGWDDPTKYNDLYSWNGTTWAQVIADGAAGSPSKLFGASMDFDSARGKVVLFGGYTTATLDETWELDVSTDTWSQISPTTSPPSRARHAVVYNPSDEYTYCIGGGGGSYATSSVRDVWRYKGTTWENLVFAAGNDMSSDLDVHYNYMTANYSIDSQRIVMIALNNTTNDFEVWDLDTNIPKWTKTSATGTAPSSEGNYVPYASGGLWDAANSNFVFYHQPWSGSAETWTLAYESIGTAYLPGEAFSYVSKTSTALTGCTRGIYPAYGTANWGRTFPRPWPAQSADDRIYIGQHAFSWVGREAGLYAVTWDEDTGAWNAEADAELLWYGRISTDNYSIRQDGKSKAWHLGCKSILAALGEKKLGSDLPEAELRAGINLEGGDVIRVVVVENGGFAHQYEGAISGWFPDAGWVGLELVQLLNSVGGGIVFSSGIGFDGKTSIRAGKTANSATVKIEPQSNGGLFSHALAALGFNGSGLEFEVTGYVGSEDVTVVESEGNAFVAYHPGHYEANGGQVYVYQPEKFWTNQGDGSATYAAIVVDGKDRDPASEEPAKRVFYGYDSVTSTDPGYVSISKELSRYKDPPLSRRSHFGWRFGEKPVRVRQAYVPWYQSGTRGPFEQKLFPLLSTGSGANDASYDKLPFNLSLYIPAGLVDKDSFTDADKAIGGSGLWTRNLDFVDDVSWLEWLGRESKLFGYALCWRRGQLTLSNVLELTPDAAEVTISQSSHTSPSEWPDWNLELGSVVNQFKVKLSNVVQDSEADTYTLRDVTSQVQLAITKEVDIDHKGLALGNDVSAVRDLVNESITPRMHLLRFPQPTVTVTLAPVYAYQVFAGDLVRFTSSRLPDAAGSGDYDIDVFATVLSVQWDYSTWVGTATLLLHTGYNNYGRPWAPATLIDNTADNGGWVAATQRLISVAHYYGDSATDPHDGQAFRSGDYLKIIERNPSDPTSPQSWIVETNSEYDVSTRNISIVNTTLTSWDNAKEYIVTTADWTDAATQQATNSIWQANADTGLLDSGSGNDSPQRYG